VLLAVRLADALEPGVDGPVVALDRVVGSGCEPERVEILDNTSLPTSPDDLLAIAREYFNVDHVVLLLAHLRVVVDTAQKYKITWLHLLKSNLLRERIELVGLVPVV